MPNPVEVSPLRTNFEQLQLLLRLVNFIPDDLGFLVKFGKLGRGKRWEVGLESAERSR